MRIFIYCLVYILGFAHISYSADTNNGLPPLPTLDLPGSSPAPEQKTENVPANPSNDLPENNSASDASDRNNANIAPEPVSSEGSGFIDTGNFVLPKIKKTDSGGNAPSVPSVTPDPTSDPMIVPSADVQAEAKQDQGANNMDVALPPPPPADANAPEPVAAPVEVPMQAPDESAPELPPANKDEAASALNNDVALPPVADKPQLPAQADSAVSLPPPPVEQRQTRGQAPDQATTSAQPETTPLTEIIARSKRGGGVAQADVESDKGTEKEAFVRDESVMLLLEDDDIVLGKLTKKAYLDSLHGKDYINLFLKTYVSKMDEKKAKMMDAFIRKYEFAHEGRSASALSAAEAKKLAFEALKRDNIDDLRTLIDNYSILQSYDKNGNNMLMLAIELGNVPMSKFLLIRGVDLFGQNRDGENILSISRESGDPVMQHIINDAMFIGRVK